MPQPEFPVDSLTCVIERAPEAMLVRPEGAVNETTVPLLWSTLRAMREDNLNVIIDLTAVVDIDSAGMDAFLDTYQLFSQCRQQFVLAEVSPIVRTLLEIAGLDNVMPIFASVAAARASFRSPAAPSPYTRSETGNVLLYSGPAIPEPRPPSRSAS